MDDDRRPWWTYLLTWGFWGPVLGGCLALMATIAGFLFVLDRNTDALLFLIVALLAAILFWLVTSKR